MDVDFYIVTLVGTRLYRLARVVPAAIGLDLDGTEGIVKLVNYAKQWLENN